MNRRHHKNSQNQLDLFPDSNPTAKPRPYRNETVAHLRFGVIHTNTLLNEQALSSILAPRGDGACDAFERDLAMMELEEEES
jgi:hypothetical protein